MNNNELFAYVTNAEEDSWSYGIKNLSNSLLYKLAIDYWKPNMFSSCDGDKFIELPFACLDICADALTIPKKILDSTIQSFNSPFYRIERHVAYCLSYVAVDEGDSKIIKKGMSFPYGFSYKVQLFIDVLANEILPIVKNNLSESEKVRNEISLVENCSKNKPYYLQNFFKLAERYLGCKFNIGSEALEELLETSFIDKKAYIKSACEKYNEMLDRSKRIRTVDEIITERKSINERRTKRGLEPIRIPNVEEAKIIQEQEIKNRKTSIEYAKKRIDKFINLEKNGLGISDLFIRKLRIVSIDELPNDQQFKETIIKNYKSIISVCNRINYLLQTNAPDVLVLNGRKDLQQSVDVLLYNLMVIKHIKSNERE